MTTRKELPKGLNPRDPEGDPEGFVFSPDDLLNHASLVLLVKNAAGLLEKHYPGWLWMIQPDEAGGVVNIYSLRLSGQWAYTLLTSRMQHDPNLRCVVKAGGELIERFGYRPGPFDPDAYKAGKRHFGLPVADVSDKSKRFQREYRTHALQVALETGQARILTDTDIAAAKRMASA